MEAAEQFVGLQTFLARQLQGTDAHETVLCGYMNIGFAIGEKASCFQIVWFNNFFCLEDFQNNCCTIGVYQLSPC